MDTPFVMYATELVERALHFKDQPNENHIKLQLIQFPNDQPKLLARILSFHMKIT